MQKWFSRPARLAVGFSHPRPEGTVEGGAPGKTYNLLIFQNPERSVIVVDVD